MNDEVESIAEKIMTYLQKRPMASDSLNGIIHWWLVQQAIETNTELVTQALEKLAEEGKISKQEHGKRDAIYRLSPTNRPE